MYGLKNSFKKISEEIQIPFKLIEKDGAILVDFLQVTNEKIISDLIKIPTEELILETYEEYSNCLNLLKCYLEQVLSDAFKSKEEIILDILKGKEYSEDILKEVIKYKPFKLILIYLNEKNLKVLDIIEKNNKEENSMVVAQDEYILIVSKNDISYDKINELFNLVSKNIAQKVYLTYCEIDEYRELKEKYEYLKGNIGICLKYELASKVYTENSLLIEKMVNNSSIEEITRAYKQYNNVFSKLDDELIKTIEIFFREGLKVSESADKLYIHRNTLFYRIDKIKKIINYDISNFNEALEFKALFLLWKEAIYRSKL
ncbi:helix-turn-helix domain-containing protein [Clostridium sp. AL.422]|uniref:PucR family transcriptional regulator n=1 Tax=Clostridium TaxID=1485 RepID=UPI00293DC679|nr:MULTISPECIES: helix-turn-helix domain-containing protein [unclassified Clostridium]MDV4149878.1 helix-turn-helix domain-containing protein [Clostridium sp. AL.422]